MREKGKDQIDGITNYIYIENFPTLATPSYTDLEQQTPTEASHICIFLPKFHCKLNLIEYFWSAVKRYLQEHCDYTFTTLQENLPKAC